MSCICKLQKQQLDRNATRLVVSLVGSSSWTPGHTSQAGEVVIFVPHNTAQLALLLGLQSDHIHGPSRNLSWPRFVDPYMYDPLNTTTG